MLGISAGVAGLVVTLIGLNTSENAWFDHLNSEGTLITLRVIMSFVPIASLVFALFYFIRKFILDEKKMEEISAALKAKNS